ncbi:hypothetical protein AB447_208005 [Bacillus glycinifermentans]|uniref:Peptidoglycan binding-like domain-containing protein n=1 Tax=Bacillus glycinifermentans TaxID=1664069 RepID=A0A0T6BIJ3_9BACI|nr:hypothetical protein AB447_208005 [Bacillus glycinifermentans]
MSNTTASTSQPSKSTGTIHKKGSSGSNVKALQKRLIAADGIYGPATEKALKAIEAKKKKSLSSGKKSSYTLPAGIYKVKSPLMKGTAVRQIHEALAALYFYPDKGAKNNGIDGYYGQQTANAVKRFQMMHGLYLWDETKAKHEALLK